MHDSSMDTVTSPPAEESKQGPSQGAELTKLDALVKVDHIRPAGYVDAGVGLPGEKLLLHRERDRLN